MGNYKSEVIGDVKVGFLNDEGEIVDFKCVSEVEDIVYYIFGFVGVEV